jgi:hypothetical protein
LELEARHIRVRVLQAVLVSVPTAPETIAQLLMVDASTVISTVESFHAVLYSLDKTIRWYHASFPDAIFDDQRFRFLIPPPPANRLAANAILFRSVEVQHSLMAHNCFRSMEMELNCYVIKSPSEIEHTSSSALQYSVWNWFMHLRNCNQSKLDSTQFSTLCNRLQAFLWQHLLFWVGALSALSSDEFEAPLQELHLLQVWAEKVDHICQNIEQI